MYEEYVEEPFYLLIVDWMMTEGRWITIEGISCHFDIEHCKVINTLPYILSEVGEVVCEVKMIPDQIVGRGCQYQRSVKVVSIDSHFYSRLNHNLQEKKVSMVKTPRPSAVPPIKLGREQKWQMMLSKGICHQ